MDMRELPWDGTAGVTLTAAWDGYGMTATQSHAMAFADMPAVRSAWPGDEREQDRLRFKRPAGHLFTSVIVGIVEMAIETARQQLEPKRGSMRAYEQVEWSKVEMEGWLIKQADEGVLREAEAGRNASRSGLLCKEAVAELAESVLLRISKIVGGSAYSRHLPYGFWQEDVWGWGSYGLPGALLSTASSRGHGVSSLDGSVEQHRQPTVLSCVSPHTAMYGHEKVAVHFL